MNRFDENSAARHTETRTSIENNHKINELKHTAKHKRNTLTNRRRQVADLKLLLSTPKLFRSTSLIYGFQAVMLITPQESQRNRGEHTRD